MQDLCDIFDDTNFDFETDNAVEAPIMSATTLGIALAIAEDISDEYAYEREARLTDMLNKELFIEREPSDNAEFVSLKSSKCKKDIPAFEQMVYKDCGLI